MSRRRFLGVAIGGMAAVVGLTFGDATSSLASESADSLRRAGRFLSRLRWRRAQSRHLHSLVTARSARPGDPEADFEEALALVEDVEHVKYLPCSPSGHSSDSHYENWSEVTSEVTSEVAAEPDVDAKNYLLVPYRTRVRGGAEIDIPRLSNPFDCIVLHPIEGAEGTRYRATAASRSSFCRRVMATLRDA